MTYQDPSDSDTRRHRRKSSTNKPTTARTRRTPNIRRDYENTGSAVDSESEEDYPRERYDDRHPHRSRNTASHTRMNSDPTYAHSTRRSSGADGHRNRTKSHSSRNHVDVDPPNRRRKSSVAQPAPMPSPGRHSRRDVDEEDDHSSGGEDIFDSGSESLIAELDDESLKPSNLEAEIIMSDGDSDADSEDNDESRTKYIDMPQEGDKSSAETGDEGEAEFGKTKAKTAEKSDASEEDEDKDSEHDSDKSGDEDAEDKALVTFKSDGELEADIKAEEKKRAEKKPRRRGHRRDSQSQVFSDVETKKNFPAPTPPQSGTGTPDDRSETDMPPRGHARKMSGRAPRRREAYRESPLSQSPRTIPPGMPNSERVRRSRRSNGDYEFEGGSSLGSDGRGSFSRHMRKDGRRKGSNSGSYEQTWRDDGLRNHSPGRVIESDDACSSGDDEARRNRRSKRRNSRNGSSGTPPGPSFRHRGSTSGPQAVPDPPQEGFEEPESFSARRPKAPRSMSGSSRTDGVLPAVPPSPGTQETRRRPSHSTMRPVLPMQQRPNSTIQEDPVRESAFDRPGPSGAKQRRPITVPVAPGADESVDSESEGYRSRRRSEVYDAEPEEVFPEALDTLPPGHCFIKLKELVMQEMSRRLGGQKAGRSMRGSSYEEHEEGLYASSPASRRQSVGRRKRDNFACPFVQNGASLFRGCGGFVFDDIEALGTHLEWFHRNTIHCPRCMKTFQTDEECKNHAQQEPPCEPGARRHNGLEEEDRARIREIIERRSVPPNVRWAEVYRVIFDDGVVPSAYPEEGVLGQLRAFMDYAEDFGAKDARNVVEQRGAMLELSADYIDNGYDLDRSIRLLVRMAMWAGCYNIFSAWQETHDLGIPRTHRERGPSMTMAGPPGLGNMFINVPPGPPESPSSFTSFSPRTPASGGGNWPGYGAPASMRRATTSGFEGDYGNPRIPRRTSMSRGLSMPVSGGVGPVPIPWRGGVTPVPPPPPPGMEYDAGYGSVPKGGYYGEVGMGMGVNMGMADEYGFGGYAIRGDPRYQRG